MPCLTFERRMPVQPLFVALAAAVACGLARADEPSPYFIGVTQALTHDSNINRIPNGTGDNYSSTGIVAGLDQRIGRQRVYASAGLQFNKYQDQDRLDNTSYNVSGGWDFNTIERFSGGLSLSATQNLASTSNSNTLAPTTDRNIAQTEQFGARIGWGGDAALTLNSSYAHSRVHYSTPAYATSESSQDSVSAGANYRVGATLGVGAALRLARSVAPKGIQVAPGVFAENTANSRNIDFLVDWRPTAQTTLGGRLSLTRQTNSGVSGRDFSGLTGALNASYTPTAKLSFNAALSRDAGANSAFFNLTNATNGTTSTVLSESSQVSNNVALGAVYAATAKINVNAGANWRRTELVDSLGGGSVDRTDDVKSVSLGANYAITRAWSVACNISHEQRDVSGNAAVAGFAYTANVVGCTTQFTLR